MPRKRKSVTASIQNGQRSGESREVKRKRTEDRRTVVDKENFEVSPRHNLMTLPSILSEILPEGIMEELDKRNIV
jgi:hypothetical protein